MRFFPLVAATALFAGTVAKAESFAFTFGDTSSSFSGSGTFTTGSPEAPGEYLITAVTGTVKTTPNGADLTIRSILAPGVFPTTTNGNDFPANDNTLFANNGVGSLSQDGTSFILSNGAQINLYNDGPGNNALLERTNGKDVLEDVPTTITQSAATPELSSFALLGTGLLGIISVRKRPSLRA